SSCSFATARKLIGYLFSLANYAVCEEAAVGLSSTFAGKYIDSQTFPPGRSVTFRLAYTSLMTSKRNIPTRRFIKPSFNFLIEKKRDGGEFTQEEIRYIIDSTLDGEMPQHQLAALAMAIYFSGMSAQETADLTEEMMLSGEVIDLSHIAKPKIDKYSTGGVGDKTSLVLVPLAM